MSVWCERYPGFDTIAVDQELCRLLDELRASTGFIQALQHRGGAMELSLTVFPHGDCRMEPTPEMSSLPGRMGLALEGVIRYGETSTHPVARS
jgi:hypothetical protein